MVRGLDVFKEYFKDYTDNYIIIGGTACDILIDEAGFSSHSDIATAMMPWFVKPFARLSVASPYSSKRIIKKVKIPVLIIHSTEDETVPFRMGEKVYNNANEPKEFWKIKGKHCYAITDYKKEFIAKLDSLIGVK